MNDINLSKHLHRVTDERTYYMSRLNMDWERFEIVTSNLLRELKRTDGYTKHSWIAFSGMMMPLIDIQKRLLYVCL